MRGKRHAGTVMTRRRAHLLQREQGIKHIQIHAMLQCVMFFASKSEAWAWMAHTTSWFNGLLVLYFSATLNLRLGEVNYSPCVGVSLYIVSAVYRRGKTRRDWDATQSRRSD